MNRLRRDHRIRDENRAASSPRRSLSTALVVVIALLALPMTVAARPPEVETFYDEDSGSFAAPCPNGVTLVYSFTENLRVTTFFDNDGNPIRAQMKLDHFGVITNPDTGQSVTDPSHQTIFVDLVDGTVTQVGLVFRTTVPGVGVVNHDAGKVVFDADDTVTFVAGPHDLLETEGPHAVRTLMCEALT